MTIARAQMNRQLYGIGNLVEREKYGLGSKLKKFVRNIIPNEVASVASAAAPFVAPFNPLLAAGMAGLGSFDKTGSISKGLTSAALTYGGGQIARGIGGAGFQTGINPFDAASLGQSASSFIGVPYSSPLGTTTGLQLGQYTDAGRSAINQMEPFGGSATAGTFSKAPGTFDQLRTIFDPTSGVDFGTRAQTAMNLTADAIKSIYTIPDGKGGTTVDKKAVIATLSAIPSYLDAKKKADQIGLSSNEFNEQIYNQEKQSYQSMYQSRLPMESFGIRTTAQMGGIMNGFQQQQEEPIFPRLETLSENLGQAEQTLGQPSNQSNASSITTAITGQQPQGFAEGGLLSIKLTPREGYFLGNLVSKVASGVVEPTGSTGAVYVGEGGGIGNLIRKLISNNPNMFQQTQQQRSVSANPVNDLYKYYLENDTDEDYKRRIMESVKPRFGVAMGGEIPIRQNQQGTSELDLRAKGGYIPVGIKEKADDVPAMLSKNEFVFTADAVRGAGDGSINKGAQKMYKLMKSLEKKVKKTKVA
jgi:hypothetical protein